MPYKLEISDIKFLNMQGRMAPKLVAGGKYTSPRHEYEFGFESVLSPIAVQEEKEPKVNGQFPDELF